MKPARRKARSAVTALVRPAGAPLLADLRKMILSARAQVARTVDAGLALLYWQVGHRIRREVLQEKLADYGKEIVQTLSGQLGWSHFDLLLRVDDSLARDFYAEKDLEAAILREMEAFILELGTGFSIVARQKRMTVGGVGHHLDLLFFHRQLRRLVAIDLKLGAFAPADKGQMELYLAWLKEHETVAGEDAPLGLILCAGKNDETIRLLGLEKGDIRVASYLAKALPQKQLERKLHDAVRLARARLAARSV